MRIIAGTFRSRSLQAPPGLSTRPTSDRLRETLFNVLAPRMEGAHFLDLYAGSGAVGIEAMSRGAARVVFVERAVPALKVLRGNLARLGLSSGFEIHAGAVKGFLARESGAQGFDVVFLDPPYDAAGEYESVLGILGGVTEPPRSQRVDALSVPRSQNRDLGHPHLGLGSVVVAEHRRKDRLPETVGALRRTRLLQQGDAALSFYALRGSQESQAEPQDGSQGESQASTQEESA